MITIWIAAIYAAAVFLIAYTAGMMAVTAYDRGKAIVDTE